MSQILEEQLKYVNTMFNRYIRQKEIIIDYNNHLKSIISNLNERIVKLTNQNRATQEELSKCQPSIGKEIKNKKNDKEEIENLQRLITEKENKINQLKSDIKEKDQDINDKEKAIKAYKSKIDDLMNDPSVLNAMNNKQTDVNITKEAFQKEKDNFELEIRVKQKIIAEKDEKIKNNEKTIEENKNTLTKAIDEKKKIEEQLSEERSKLKQKDMQFNDLKESYENKVKKINEEYESKLSEKGAIIAQKDSEINNINKELLKVKNLLSDKDNILIQKDNELKGKSDNAEKKLSEKEAIIDIKVKEIKDKENTIVKMKRDYDKQINDAKQELLTKNLNIEEKNKKIKEIKELYEQKISELKEKNSIISKNNKEIELLNNTLSDAKKKISEKEHSIIQKENQIKENTKAITELKLEISTKSDIITQKEQVIKEKELIIATKEKTINENRYSYEHQKEEMQKIINEKENMISNQISKIKEKENIINNKIRTIQEKESKITDLKGIIDKSSQEITLLKKQNNELQSTITKNNNIIISLKSSIEELNKRLNQTKDELTEKNTLIDNIKYHANLTKSETENKVKDSLSYSILNNNPNTKLINSYKKLSDFIKTLIQEENLNISQSLSKSIAIDNYCIIKSIEEIQDNKDKEHRNILNKTLKDIYNQLQYILKFKRESIKQTSSNLFSIYPYIYISQNKEHEILSLKMSKISDLLSSGWSFTDKLKNTYSRSNSVISFIGNSSSGKTTMLNYIFDTNIKSISPNDINFVYFPNTPNILLIDTPGLNQCANSFDMKKAECNEIKRRNNIIETIALNTSTFICYVTNNYNFKEQKEINKLKRRLCMNDNDESKNKGIKVLMVIHNKPKITTEKEYYDYINKYIITDKNRFKMVNNIIQENITNEEIAKNKDIIHFVISQYNANEIKKVIHKKIIASIQIPSMTIQSMLKNSFEEIGNSMFKSKKINISNNKVKILEGVIEDNLYDDESYWLWMDNLIPHYSYLINKSGNLELRVEMNCMNAINITAKIANDNNVFTIKGTKKQEEDSKVSNRQYGTYLLNLKVPTTFCILKNTKFEGKTYANGLLTVEYAIHPVRHDKEDDE